VDYDIELEAGSGRELTLSLRLSIAGAEPDVGIMGDYVDDWEVTGFAGHFSKRAINRFKAFLDSRPKLCEAINEHLSEAELD
jgi:hypothetical protein